jgi:hypothetical protein
MIITAPVVTTESMMVVHGETLNTNLVASILLHLSNKQLRNKINLHLADVV